MALPPDEDRCHAIAHAEKGAAGLHSGRGNCDSGAGVVYRSGWCARSVPCPCQEPNVRLGDIGAAVLRGCAAQAGDGRSEVVRGDG